MWSITTPVDTYSCRGRILANPLCGHMMNCRVTTSQLTPSCNSHQFHYNHICLPCAICFHAWVNCEEERQRHSKQVNYTPQDSSFIAYLNHLITRWKGKARQTNQLHPGQLFLFKETKKSCLGGIRTHDTLQFRRALYQLSHQGNSAGKGSNLQHNTSQHSILSLSM